MPLFEKYNSYVEAGLKIAIATNGTATPQETLNLITNGEHKALMEKFLTDVPIVDKGILISIKQKAGAFYVDDDIISVKNSEGKPTLRIHPSNLEEIEQKAQALIKGKQGPDTTQTMGGVSPVTQKYHGFGGV